MDKRKLVAFIICGVIAAILVLLCSGFIHRTPETGSNEVSIDVLTAQDGHEYVVASVDNRSLINHSGGCGVSIVHAYGCSKCKRDKQESRK